MSLKLLLLNYKFTQTDKMNEDNIRVRIETNLIHLCSLRIPYSTEKQNSYSLRLSRAVIGYDVEKKAALKS